MMKMNNKKDWNQKMQNFLKFCQELKVTKLTANNLIRVLKIKITLEAEKRFICHCFIWSNRIKIHGQDLKL
jgi:hypothetical protein